ncbi:DUF58 domain-containing protein [Tessaracoccus flavus]|nr:DUF58 domain-containing protein [Tessaracoccus flavus]SDY34018.1 Uncharacterized conserved protein, DUF58 family, contains vWF domain [Tessaracoccus flavus]
MVRNGTRLTGRGVALVLLGALASAAAAYIGELDLLWLTVALVALPLLSVVYLVLARPRVRYERSVDPSQIPVGTTTRVVLRVANQSPAQSSALRFADAAPEPLGGGASFLIARGFGRWRQAVGYTVEATRRGRFHLGPLRGTATDPFALAARTFTAKGDESVLRVTPKVWPLGKLSGAAGMGSAGDATPQRLGPAGQDDVLVREHRHGDDMRRVHWKLSAKQDDLMVRLEEHPWDPSSTLIVDTRTAAHFGDGPRGSLEWAVSAVASVAALLTEGRHRVAILSPSGVVHQSGRAVGESAKRAMIESLTDLTASDIDWLGEAVADPEAMGSSAAVIAVTGLLKPSDAAALVAASARARKLIALVPDADAWGGAPHPEHDKACRLLLGHGWTVERYRPGETVPLVWERVSR